MIGKVKISKTQTILLCFLVIAGGEILFIPTSLVEYAEQDSWISCLLGVGAGIVFIFFYTAFSRRFPQKSLAEINELVFGKLFGKLISFLFYIYFLLVVVLMIREFCEFVKIQFYTQTPLVALYILFMTVIVFAPILGLETFSRAAEIFFPLIVLLLFVLIIFSLPDVEFENFLPMFENGIKPIIHGAIKYQFFTSLQLVVFLVIMPSLDGGGSDKKPFFIGVLSAGFILTLLTSLAIGVLGTKLIHLLNYPNFVLARNIYIGDFVTRIEVFIVWIWFLTIFFKSVLYFYALSFGIAQSLKLSDHRMLIIPLGIIIIVCAMIISPNPVYYTEALPYWNSFIVTMGLVIPLLILGIAKIRKL